MPKRKHKEIYLLTPAGNKLWQELLVKKDGRWVFKSHFGLYDVHHMVKDGMITYNDWMAYDWNAAYQPYAEEEI